MGGNMILYEKRYKETRKEYAYRVLKDNIMTLNLKPGELLASEADLAKKLNISRTPIREVIMSLRNEYLIDVKPQTGTYISLIDWNLIKEASFTRYIMEKEVLKECTEYFPEDILIELEKNLFTQKIIENKQNSQIEFYELDKEFHRLLFLGTKKMNIWDCIANISTHYDRMRVLQQDSIDRKLVIQQHEEHINIIKNKSLEKINEIVTQHIKAPLDGWNKAIKEDSKIFKYINK